MKERVLYVISSFGTGGICRALQNTLNCFDINKYEVDETDTSPINYNYKNVYELTLITCNNFNNNRIIVKARTESL